MKTRITTASRLIRELMDRGVALDTIAAKCSSSVEQVRRLRTAMQPAASEETLLILAELAGYSAQGTAQLVLENALERLGESGKGALVARISATASDVGSNRFLPDIPQGVLKALHADLLSREELVASILAEPSHTTHPNASWVARPNCVYIAVASKRSMGGTVVEVDMANLHFIPGASYVVAEEDGQPRLMTFLSEIPGTTQLAFAGADDMRQTMRIVPRPGTVSDPGVSSLTLIGKATRVVHQAL